MRPRSQRSRVRSQSSRLRTRVPETGRVHPLTAVVGRRPQVLAPEETLARLVHEHRVVRDRAPVVVQVVRALGVGVVGARVERKVALVEDRELVGVEVVVLGEVGAAGELDPGGVRDPSRFASAGARSPEQALPRQFLRPRERRVACDDRERSLQRNSSTGNRPLGGKPPALLQEPGRVRVLEAVDRVAEHDVVASSPGAGTRCRRRARCCRRAEPCRDRSVPCSRRRRSDGRGPRRSSSVAVRPASRAART